MLEQNKVPAFWGDYVPPWICERCGIANNTWDRNNNLSHVYRDRIRDAGPLLDLCGLCRAHLTTRRSADTQPDLFWETPA